MKAASWLVAVACIIVFALRLWIAFSTPGFSGDDAYWNIRQIEHIRATGMPLYDDPLSYGGRTFVFSPVFHYIIAASTLVLPVEFAAKVMPNLFATLLILIIFGIVRRLSKHDGVALFTAIFSAFVPVWFAQTINTLSIATFAVPLLFFVVYAFLRIQEQRWRYFYLIGLILFSFTHPLVLLFVLGLMIYLILILVERLHIDRTEMEITLFSIFFVLWSQFLLYKKFILAHGPGVVWQNIPPDLLSTLFQDITILTAIYQIGILPVLYGVFVVYRYLFRRRHKMTYFLIAFTLAAVLLLWFRLIPLLVGLILLGMFLLVLFSKWVDFYLKYVHTTRFHKLQPLLVLSLIIAFILTSILPAWLGAWNVQSEAISPEGLRAYKWIQEQTLPSSVVIAAVSDGHRVTALTEKKNVIDNHFLLKRDAKQRLHDVKRVLTTTFSVEAINLMDRYGSEVILLSPQAKRELKIDTLAYAPSRCFAIVYDEGGYEVFVKVPYCVVEEVA